MMLCKNLRGNIALNCTKRRKKRECEKMNFKGIKYADTKSLPNLKAKVKCDAHLRSCRINNTHNGALRSFCRGFLDLQVLNGR